MSLQKQTLNLFLDSNIQVSKEALDLLLEQEKPLETAQQLLDSIQPDIVTLLPKHIKKEPEKLSKPSVSILHGFEKNKPIKDVQDLSEFFNNRYTYFRKLLSSRLSNPTSLNNLTKMQKEKASTIGLVCGKRTTSKGNILLELEDPTGKMRMVASNPKVKKDAENLVMDEVVAVSGTTSNNTSNNIMFLDEIIWPDVPVTKDPKKLKQECYAVFLSDTHIGSKKFMEREFNRFISWIKGEIGGEDQTTLVKKIKYCFVAGDIVDGVGIYPRQNEELAITNIEAQYQKAAELFSEIPKHVRIIISPGNHDFIRIGQPQPPLDPEVAAPLYELRNTDLVGNPVTFKIEEHDNGGLGILIYHGVSLDTMVTADPSLKNGYKEPHIVMKSLLKRRHLSPPYNTGLVAVGEDQMIIRTVPDIFHSGHVHSNGNTMYRGISIISSGAWQGQTAFQKLCGHEPTPAILPLMNLQTRELKLINFNYAK